MKVMISEFHFAVVMELACALNDKPIFGLFMHFDADMSGTCCCCGLAWYVMHFRVNDDIFPKDKK